MVREGQLEMLFPVADGFVLDSLVIPLLVVVVICYGVLAGDEE